MVLQHVLPVQHIQGLLYLLCAMICMHIWKKKLIGLLGGEWTNYRPKWIKPCAFYSFKKVFIYVLHIRIDLYKSVGMINDQSNQHTRHIRGAFLTSVEVGVRHFPLIICTLIWTQHYQKIFPAKPLWAKFAIQAQTLYQWTSWCSMVLPM